MAPTSEERREVARKIREYVSAYGDRIEDAEMVLLGTVRSTDDSGEVFLPTSEAELLTMLADLIDPTCTYEPTETLNYWDEQDREHDTNQPDTECGTFSCSWCGNEMLYGEDGGWFDTEPPYAPLFMFCPGCGARVLPMVMRDRVVRDD